MLGRRVRRTARADLWVATRAWLVLWLIVAAFAAGLPLDALERFLARPGRVRRSSSPPVARWARLVAAAGRYHPCRIACLERSLCLAYLLSRRGVESRLRIGVRCDRSELEAHAWLEVGGEPVIDVAANALCYLPLERAGSVAMVSGFVR